MPPFIKKVVEEVEKKDLRKIKATGFEKDFELFKKALPAIVSEPEYYHARDIHPVTGLGRIIGEVYICKKIVCKNSFKASDKVRVVFQVNGDEITIIEVFYKGDKELEDKQRILCYCQPPA